MKPGSKTTKVSAFFLTMLLLFSLSACHQTNTAPTIGICFGGFAGSISGHRQALTDTLTAAGFQVLTADAHNDQSKQLSQMETFLEQNCDLLIVEQVMTSATEEMQQCLSSSDTPVIFLTREPEEAMLEALKQACFVGCDACRPGFLMGQALLQLPKHGDLNGDGVVSYAFITGPEDHMDSRLRMDQCREALTQAGANVQEMYTGYGNWSRESGQRCSQQILGIYGKDVEVLLCCSDVLVLGAAEAIRATGREAGQDVYLLGIGNDPVILSLLESGQISAVVSMDLESHTDTVLSAAYALLDGQTVAPRQYIDYTIITE